MEGLAEAMAALPGNGRGRCNHRVNLPTKHAPSMAHLFAGEKNEVTSLAQTPHDYVSSPTPLESPRTIDGVGVGRCERRQFTQCRHLLWFDGTLRGVLAFRRRLG